MDGITLGMVGSAVLVVLILARMPVGAAMILVGFAGFGYVAGFKSALDLLQVVPCSTFASQGMSRWPLWFLMLGLCIYSGLAHNLFTALSLWLSRFKNGMAIAALFVCAFLGAMSAFFGKAGLEPATKMLWPHIQRRGARGGLSAGVLTAGFSLGILLPLPTSLLIIYGVITEQSIGGVFLCSIMPLLISFVLYIIAIMVARRNIASATIKASSGLISYARIKDAYPPEMMPATTISYKLLPALGLMLIFFIIIGSMFLGVFTSSEATVVGVVLTLILTALSKILNKETYAKACETALVGTGWLVMIFLGTMIFGYFLTVTRLPYEMSEALFMLNPYFVLLLLLIIVTLCGCILEPLPMSFLVIPILYPLVLKAGFHPIWFGVVAMRCIGLGIMLPYIGINLRLVQRLTGISAHTAARGIMPFVIADIILIVLLILFPEIVLFPLAGA